MIPRETLQVCQRVLFFATCGLLLWRGSRLAHLSKDYTEESSSGTTRLLLASKLTEDLVPWKVSNETIHQHWHEVASRRLARAFQPHHQWCHKEPLVAHPKDPHGNKPNFWVQPKGLFYVKMPKAASSTLAGIVQRISRSSSAVAPTRGPHSSKNLPCTSHQGHFGNSVRPYSNRHSDSFLFSSVRNPAKRALSRVFFSHVFAHRASDKSILRALNLGTEQAGSVSDGQGGFQLRYMALQEIAPWSAWNASHSEHVVDRPRVEEAVRNVLRDYNFIVVVERMEESLVALQLLLGVDAGDILVTSSKISGGYTLSSSKGRHKCVKMAKAIPFPAVDEFLHSNEWYAKNYGDYLLHAAANQSLDLTIQALGVDRFQKALAEYRRLKELERRVCAPHAIFPCSAQGENQMNVSKYNCYHDDEGCGYPCIDEMLRNDTLQKEGKIAISR